MAYPLERQKIKQVSPSSGTDVYPHMPIQRSHAARLHEWRISSVTFTSAHLSTLVFTSRWAWPVRWPIHPFLSFWGANFTKICDSLPQTPMNRRAKCDAASSVLGVEIRNRTNTHTHTHKNKQ